MRISARASDRSSSGSLPCPRSPRRGRAAWAIAVSSSALEGHDAGARQKRGIQLEARVLGGRADQRDRAVLHDRQKPVLLRPVEPMDLVDEKKRAGLFLVRSHLAAMRRASSNTFFRSATPVKIAEICTKARFGLARQQARHRRLAGAGRPPEDQRADRLSRPISRDSAPCRTNEVILPRHLVEPSAAAAGRRAGGSRRTSAPRPRDRRRKTREAGGSDRIRDEPTTPQDRTRAQEIASAGIAQDLPRLRLSPEFADLYRDAAEAAMGLDE